MFGLILQKMFATIAVTATITCSTYMQIDSTGEALYDLGFKDDITTIAHNNEYVDAGVESVYDSLDEAFGGDYGPKLNQTTQDVIDQLPQNNSSRKKDEEEEEANAEEEAKRQADELEAQQKKEFEEEQARLEEEHKKQEEEYKKEIEVQEKEIQKQEDEYKKELEEQAAQRQAQAEQYKQDSGMEM